MNDPGEIGNREFPAGAANRPASLPRRDFVKLLGASMALAGIGGCVREPDQKILPYVTGTGDVIPGEARHYATAMTIDGYATGVIVESHEGRPTKVEGNPTHPASLGAAGVYEQASVLQLYDPHRARVVRAGRRRSTWDAASAALAPAALTSRVGARGAGLRLLLEPTSSPLIAAWLARVQDHYPDARVYFSSALDEASLLDASRSTFGAPLVPRYDLVRAGVIVSLGADLLASGPFHLRHARDFAARRADVTPAELFVAECCPSPTGTVADHRLAASPSAIGRLAAALAAALASDGSFGPRAAGIDRSATVALTDAERAWVQSAGAALVRGGSGSLVVADRQGPAEVQVLAHAMNAMLGAAARTVSYSTSPIFDAGEPNHRLSALDADLASGGVDTLIVLEGNPCYAAPADLPLASRMRGVRSSIYLGLYDDETASGASWHIPAAHYLETWGDSRAYDGTESVVQPLIAPLYDGHTVAEVLATLAGAPGVAAHDLVRGEWRTRRGATPDSDTLWDESVQGGMVNGTALGVADGTVASDAVATAHRSLVSSGTAPSRDSIELRFPPSPAVYDGRFADNAWLQELPDPTTKLTWDNAALLAPSLATRLGIASGDVVELRVGDRIVDVPALIVPGHAAATISLPLGYGRSGAEAIARGVGVNANRLRTSTALDVARGVSVRPLGRRAVLAVTQGHWSIEGRSDNILGLTESGAPLPPTPPAVKKRRPLTLYEPAAPSSTGFGADQWAMVIDLDQCTGCSACVVACQAENNVPVVGKDGVLESREMQWLRIDRYLSGPDEAPLVDNQPMLCQHCEKAPCEYVCPVDATVHSDDGLNEMIYNRCVGTRFCSNNCPYKVRRFNWFAYNDDLTPVERMVKNPEVTVRARGVMEKCTFCVQRIRHAQRDAALAGEPHTGPVETACQQTCPSKAIVFGSLTAADSNVARLSDDPRAFSALAEQGTVPRVRYLARRPRTDA